jgi:hypothetical protein
MLEQLPLWMAREIFTSEDHQKRDVGRLQPFGYLVISVKWYLLVDYIFLAEFSLQLMDNEGALSKIIQLSHCF